MNVEQRDGDSGRILVTGSNGFVGRRLMRRLMEHASCRLFTIGRRPAAGDDVSALDVDLRNESEVRRAVAFARPDFIFHLAAQSSSAASSASPRDAWEVNAVATMLLADAAREYVPEATFFFVSSTEVYGAAFNDGVVSEDTVPRPMSVYGKSKLAAENILQDVLPPTMQCIIARPTNHSGPGQDGRFVLPAFAAQVASGKTEIHVGNIAVERDFLHVDDVIDAYLSLMKCRAGIENRACFNIASGNPVSLERIIQRLFQMKGVAGSIVIDEAKRRPSDVPRTLIRADRIARATGWRPRRTLDDLLGELLEEHHSGAPPGR